MMERKNGTQQQYKNYDKKIKQFFLSMDHMYDGGKTVRKVHIIFYVFFFIRCDVLECVFNIFYIHYKYIDCVCILLPCFGVRIILKCKKDYFFLFFTFLWVPKLWCMLYVECSVCQYTYIGWYVIWACFIENDCMRESKCV